MAVIQSGATTDLLTVEAASKAARVSPFDAAGNPIAPVSRGAVPATVGGLLNAGVDYKLARALRVDETGALRTNQGGSLLLVDHSEGAAYNSNLWVQTASTATLSQTAVAGRTFNSGSSVTASQGIVHVSHRQFPLVHGGRLLARFLARATAHGANAVIEMGFGAPASAVALTATNGAHWRKDTGGQWHPVICINSTEYLGTPISNATFIAAVPVTDYAVFTVELCETLARFCIYTQAGVLVAAQDMEWASLATGVAGLAVTHIPVYSRVWNNGTAALAVLLYVKSTTVEQLDVVPNREHQVAQSGMCFNSLTSPTAFTQAAAYGNGADPAAAALSNTTPSYTSLGGLFIGPTPTPVGALTDFPLFGFTVPAPYTFFVTGVRICCINRGAAIATTATVLEWFLAANASSGSLASAAPYAPMRVALGQQIFAIGATIDSAPNPPFIDVQFPTPLAVQPGRVLIVGLRIPIGTATASGFLRGSVAVNGFYE
jgi:hypothetical protein